MRKLLVVPTMIFGSFLIYCTQVATHSLDQASRPDAGDTDGPDGSGSGNGPGGFVKDASAEPCTPTAPAAPQFTKLATVKLTQTARTSIPIAVGAYREVVVSLLPGSSDAGCVFAEFRPDAQTAFGTTGQYIGRWGGRLRVDGTDLQLSNRCGSDDASFDLVVAGVR
jgi:hypothetical protein